MSELARRIPEILHLGMLIKSITTGILYSNKTSKLDRESLQSSLIQRGGGGCQTESHYWIFNFFNGIILFLTICPEMLAPGSSVADALRLDVNVDVGVKRTCSCFFRSIWTRDSQ